MTSHKPANAVRSRRRVVWSWLALAVEAAMAVVWVGTIASALSGDWPHPVRWIMLLSITGMVVSRRIRTRHPTVSDSLFFVAAIVAVVAMTVSRS